MALPAWLKGAKNSSGRRTLAQPPIVEGQDHAPSHLSPSSSSKAADELKALMARVRKLAPLLCTLSPEELSADENDLVDLAARLDPSAVIAMSRGVAREWFLVPAGAGSTL